MAAGQGTYLFRLLAGKCFSRDFADPVPTELMNCPPPPPIPVMKTCLTTSGLVPRSGWAAIWPSYDAVA